RLHKKSNEIGTVHSPIGKSLAGDVAKCGRGGHDTDVIGCAVRNSFGMTSAAPKRVPPREHRCLRKLKVRQTRLRHARAIIGIINPNATSAAKSTVVKQNGAVGATPTYRCTSGGRPCGGT